MKSRSPAAPLRGAIVEPRKRQIAVLMGVAGSAVALSALFWWPLFRGGGLVGGDVYSYYFPQKEVYAQELAHGRLPTWNNRVGFGYPILGESQTGVFYPFNLLLYRLFPLNAAYSVNHLVHYALAFVFLWLYARRIGIGRWGAGLAGLVYTYGWFPPRGCWEWAILGGAWMPAALWCAENFLETLRLRHALALCAVLTLQLLAGHFNLAFLTLLVLVPYVAIRVFFATGGLPSETCANSRRAFFTCLAAVVGAFLLAAPQIGPTWEMKRHSQRNAPGPEHLLAQGSIPVEYLSQVFAPWQWYSLDRDRDAWMAEQRSRLGAPTNQVEAHLYFGLIPLALALVTLLPAIRLHDRLSLAWFVLGALAVVYATGVLLGVTQYLPGFNFFQDPGRYGLITTFAVAVLAGKGLDRLRSTGSLPLGLAVLLAFLGSMWTALKFTTLAQSMNEQFGSTTPFTLGGAALTDSAVTVVFLVGFVMILAAILLPRLSSASSRPLAAALASGIFTVSILAVSTLDLWIVSRVIKYAEMVDDPPINATSASPVRQILSEWGPVARVYAPGANLVTVLGVSATPVYLTFAPTEYVDPRLKMPDEPLAARVEWLRRAGVSHVLSETPLEGTGWPVRPVWRGFDVLLNRAWGRFREPLYLYELQGGRGRVAWSEPRNGQPPKVVQFDSNRIGIETEGNAPGRVIIADLMYPGWTVTVDGREARPLTLEGEFRGVEVPAGHHTVVWLYRPHSLYWGFAVSAITLAALVLLIAIRIRKTVPRWETTSR